MRQAPSVNPFMMPTSEFKPTAPTFVPSAPSFQPSTPFQQPQPQPQPNPHAAFFAPLQPVYSTYIMEPYQPQAPQNGQKGELWPQTYQQPYPYCLGSMQPQFCQVDPDGNYKTELCKNWIETAKCRYESKCRFAHGQEELTVAAINCYNEKFKSKNCRTFYQTKQCMYGTRCMFRHEHRSYKQLHRHHQFPKLCILEALFSPDSAEESVFTDELKPLSKSRLPIFAEIQETYDAEQAAKDLSDSELSEIEHVSQSSDSENEKPLKFDRLNSGSSLNTT